MRQPGSSFKPFVYAAALTTNPKLRPTSTVVDQPICLGNWCPQNYGRTFSGSMSLTAALARSINSIPVRMSLEIGKGNAKAGRAVIVDTAKRMGLTHPLTDSSSLPIGAAEVTAIDMTAAYAVFANGGKRADPYAAWEVRNSAGEVIYRHDRDTPPKQVLDTRVVHDMNVMLHSVVEEGSGRRAKIEGIVAAGKTGTSSDNRDAWFVGFTGNLVASVWYGNDDFSVTNGLGGSTLPAMTWREVMVEASKNLPPKPIAGVQPKTASSSTEPSDNAKPVAVDASHLAPQSRQVLLGIADLFRQTQSHMAHKEPLD
ncbi:transglycosylase domain-containing protein [Microvirga aerilata]|uniref:transglycosylase domain-containing protein n=1 Tax=Microvirga aerilata TaxID=670292 RepID=UPI003635B476